MRRMRLMRYAGISASGGALLQAGGCSLDEATIQGLLGELTPILIQLLLGSLGA